MYSTVGSVVYRRRVSAKISRAASAVQPYEYIIGTSKRKDRLKTQNKLPMYDVTDIASEQVATAEIYHTWTCSVQ